MKGASTNWSKQTDLVLLVWDENAWEDYQWWQAQDRRVLRRVNLLLKDIQRNGNEGIGKPEALKHDFAGYWSRRITDEHRLAYRIAGDEVRIAACRSHYGQGNDQRPDLRSPKWIPEESRHGRQTDADVDEALPGDAASDACGFDSSVSDFETASAAAMRPTPWLLVLSGRPGTGKTTLGKSLVEASGACYLRVDVVETALGRTHQQVGADGYVVVHELAASNLLLGTPVVVDAVNPVPEARAAWADTAARTGARLVLVETHLPNRAEHRRRVETRRADIEGHRVPTWQEVEEGEWVAWNVDRDGPRVLIDTSNAVAARAQVLALIALT